MVGALEQPIQELLLKPVLPLAQEPAQEPVPEPTGADPVRTTDLLT
jgi:hypothetical protein